MKVKIQTNSGKNVAIDGELRYYSYRPCVDLYLEVGKLPTWIKSMLNYTEREKYVHTKVIDEEGNERKFQIMPISSNDDPMIEPVYYDLVRDKIYDIKVMNDFYFDGGVKEKEILLIKEI